MATFTVIAARAILDANDVVRANPDVDWREAYEASVIAQELDS